MPYENTIEYLRDFLGLRRESEVSIRPIADLRVRTPIFALQIGEQKWILKCARDINHEVQGLWISRAAGCCVPTVLAASDGLNNPLTSPFLISEFIDGIPLTASTSSLELLASLRESLKAMCAVRFREPFKTHSKTQEVAMRWNELARAPEDVHWDSDMLSHGDFDPTNLIIQRGTQRVYLIDWANWRYSDPVLDLGRLAVHGSNWSSANLNELEQWVGLLASEILEGDPRAAHKLNLGVLTELERSDERSAAAYASRCMQVKGGLTNGSQDQGRIHPEKKRE